MATPSQFSAEARGLVSVSLFGSSGQGEMVSDYSTGNSDSFSAGQTKYQLRLWIITADEQRDVNTRYLDLGVEVQVFHAISSRTAEPAYTSGDMLDHQLLLLDRESWRELPSTFELIEFPEIIQPPGLDGNVLSYTMALAVRIT